MKVRLEVKDRNEGDAISRALDDPEMRAYIVTMGILMELPDDAARVRVLQCVEILLSSAPTSRRESRELRLHDGTTKGNGREVADTGE
jgi:hypothetical protein